MTSWTGCLDQKVKHPSTRHTCLSSIPGCFSMPVHVRGSCAGWVLGEPAEEQRWCWRQSRCQTEVNSLAVPYCWTVSAQHAPHSCRQDCHIGLLQFNACWHVKSQCMTKWESQCMTNTCLLVLDITLLSHMRLTIWMLLSDGSQDNMRHALVCCCVHTKLCPHLMLTPQSCSPVAVLAAGTHIECGLVATPAQAILFAGGLQQQ